MKQKFLKKLLSAALSASMVLTLVGLLPGTNPVQAEGSTPETNVESLVSVQIGDSTYPMSLYSGDLYEVKVSGLASGTEAKLLVDGKATSVADTVNFTAETAGDDTSAETAKDTAAAADATKDIWFQYQGGELKDSEDDGVVPDETLVGNFQGLEFLTDAADETSRYDIASWTPSDAKGDLVYVGGGMYERTFYFKKLAADVSIADGGYKIAEKHTWDTSYNNNQSDGNIAATIPADSTSWTILLNRKTGAVYDSVNTAKVDREASPLTENVYLAGSKGIQASGEWKAGYEGNKFTRISDKYYVLTKQLKKGSYEFKPTFGANAWAEGDNHGFALDANQTVVFLYDASTKTLSDSKNNQKAVCDALSLTAALTVAEVKTADNGMLNFTAAFEDGKTVVLHYITKADADKGADFTDVTMTAIGNGGYTADNIWLGDAAADVYYYYTVGGEDKNDEGATTSTVKDKTVQTYKKAEFTGRSAGVNVPGTLPSGAGNWDAASNPMTYVGNQRYSFEIKDATPGSYEYKIAIGGSWTENYGENGDRGGANIPVTIPKTEDFTVLYNDISHKSVTSVNYIVADISLTGTGIPTGTKLTDDQLKGIYSAKVSLSAGTYSDLKLTWGEKTYDFSAFTLDSKKDVSFYFDPVSELYYNDANAGGDGEISDVTYDTEKAEYKSIWGAVPTETDVTFSITAKNADSVRLLVTGPETKKVDLEKKGDAVDGLQKWSVTVKFSTIGQYTYYFALKNSLGVKVYGDDDGYYGSGKISDLTSVKPYDLVVYRNGFKTPDWMKNAVIYQIFPDRFANGDTSNDTKSAVSTTGSHTSRGATDYELIDNWYTLPENPEQEDLLSEDAYKATGAYYGDRNWSNEIYGGDVKGIIKNISYLKSLGVNVIYLNPSFASISSHRYDTTDYSKLDPILGDQGDFTELVKVADENGMHIILDGVFNHVSDDSIYFDRYYKFLTAGTSVNGGKIGAYPYWAYVYDYMTEKKVSQADAEAAAKTYFQTNYGITDFDYTDWVQVDQATMKDSDGADVTDSIGLRAGKPVYSYEGWWGYDSMPVIKSTNGSEYQTASWAKEIIGNSNANNGSIAQYWLNQGSDGWRLDVANEVSDETWNHFRESVKAVSSDNVIVGEIWTDATKYLLGDMYDSVMNYMFRGFVLNFASGSKSDDVMKEMKKLRERYPAEAFYAMMNLVDSHDTTRILSYLDGIGDDRADKSLAAAFPTYAATTDEAKQKQYLAALMQFTYAGAPTIYYGDELGMVGADDPDDRRAMTWGEGSEDLTKWYARLAKIRAAYSSLRTGSVQEFSTGNDNILGFTRRDNDSTIAVLMNNSGSDVTYTLSLATAGLTGAAFKDLLSDTEVSAADGNVMVTVPARRGVLLTATDKAEDIELTEAETKALSPAWDPAYKVTSVTHPHKQTENGGSSSTSTAGESKTGSLVTEAASAATEVSVSENATAEEKAAAEAITKVTAGSGAAQTVSGDGWTSSLKAQEAAAADLPEAQNFVAAHSTEKVTVTVTPRIVINVQDANATSIKYDITPVVDITISAGSETKNLATGSKLAVNAAVTVNIPIPTSFAANGTKLYIIHKLSNGSVKYYSGIVRNQMLTFTNPDGFSEFVVTTEKPAGYVETEDAVSVSRFFNKKTGERLFTIDPVEIADLKSIRRVTEGWVLESETFKVKAKNAKDGKNLYRLFNNVTGEHLYTTDKAEYDRLAAMKEWNAEGVAFKVADRANGIPVYGMFNGAEPHQQHWYTKNKAEVTASAGWVPDGNDGEAGVRFYSFK